METPPASKTEPLSEMEHSSQAGCFTEPEPTNREEHFPEVELPSRTELASEKELCSETKPPSQDDNDDDLTYCLSEDEGNERWVCIFIYIYAA